jgi:hypothetical protein
MLLLCLSVSGRRQTRVTFSSANCAAVRELAGIASRLETGASRAVATEKVTEKVDNNQGPPNARQ